MRKLRYREVNAQGYMGLGQEQNPKKKCRVHFLPIKYKEGRWSETCTTAEVMELKSKSLRTILGILPGMYFINFPPEASFLLCFLRYHAPLLIFRIFPCWWLHLLALGLTLHFRRSLNNGVKTRAG